MIEKKDWELILKNNQEDKDKLIRQYELALPQFETIIALAKSKIAEFPEEKKDSDPAPEGIKAIVAEVKNA